MFAGVPKMSAYKLLLLTLGLLVPGGTLVLLALAGLEAVRQRRVLVPVPVRRLPR